MDLFGEAVSAPKTYFRGTHRSVSPDETLRRFTPHLSSLGITRLADITGLDCIGLPVYVAIRPNSRSLSTSQGKGLGHDSAKASAMMESIEAWHAERAEVPLVHDSYRALVRRSAAVDPLELPAAAGHTPRRDVPYFWARGWDLISGDWSYVPYEAVTLNFVFPPSYRPTFAITSNGLSSGNHPLEATVHALCEVIERDAAALWSMLTAEEKRATAVDLATVDDEGCRFVLSLLERAGLGVVAWDMTSDASVPAYACQIFEHPESARWRILGPAGGYGCHLSPAVALVRALTEAVQSRLTLIAGSRDDRFYRSYEAFGHADGLERAWKLLSQSTEGRPFQSCADALASTFEDDVRTLANRLCAVGVKSAVVVDLSRATIGIPVVKVIVPGLEGYSEGVHYCAGARAIAARKRSA